jgi:AbiU2
MEKTAKAFFLDFNEIIVCSLLLEFAKITDPECSNTKEGKRENFTIENLINSIDWSDNIKERLEVLKTETKSFHFLIKDARNRLVAHYDKKSFLNNAVLGTFTSDQGIKFIEALQNICDITHQACFGSIVGDIVVSMPGDVQDLKKTLSKALVYDKLFSEGNTEEKTRLLKYRMELE